MTTLTHVYLETSPEGYRVFGSDRRGGEYLHHAVLTRRSEAEKLVARVIVAKYKINDVHWDYRPVYGTDSWNDAGMEEDLIYRERVEGLGEANHYDYMQEAYGPSVVGLAD